MNLPPLYGWNKTSEAGEELFAVSVFLGVCNYRCPYCMNSKIVPKKIEIPEKPWEPVWEYITANKVNVVHISGGEPTMTPVPKLKDLFDKIHSLGCRVGISTNGSMPYAIDLLKNDMDYVTLDIKTDDDRYDSLVLRPEGATNKIGSENKVWETYRILCQQKIDKEGFGFEVRTTLYPVHVDEIAIRFIGEKLSAGTRWRLQPFRHAKKMLKVEAYDVTPYTKEEDADLLKIAKEYVEDVEIRYV